MDDSSSAADFECWFSDIISQGEVVTDGEAKKFNRLNIFHGWLYKYVVDFDNPSGTTGWDCDLCPDWKITLYLLDQHLISSRSMSETDGVCLLVVWWGVCTTQCWVTCKKEEGVFQSIGKVVYVDKKQEWAQETVLGNSSLH